MSRDTSKRLPLTFDVQMSIAQGGGKGQRWHVRLTDESSRMIVADVELTHEQFSRVVGGQVVSGCEGWVSPPDLLRERLGTERETKNIQVPYDEWGDTEAVRAAAQASCVDGWELFDQLKSWNSHRAKGKTYKVTLQRYVER